MLRAAGCLLLALTVASAQHLYIEATREELARAVPELASLQPASEADKLDEVLRAAAETLNNSLDLLADVSAAERINEMRLDGGVAMSGRVENYRYGIRATLDGGEQLFTEFRIDPKTGATARPPEVIQFLNLGHFMQTLGYLMPQYLSRSRFRYLGTVGNFTVLAFAQKAGEKLPRGPIVSGAGPAPLQGLVWMDSANRIVRLRTDLMGAVEGFPLQTVGTDILFAPVTFVPGSPAPKYFGCPARLPSMRDSEAANFTACTGTRTIVRRARERWARWGRRTRQTPTRSSCAALNRRRQAKRTMRLRRCARL
jgi:hypothetical protein